MGNQDKVYFLELILLLSKIHKNLFVCFFKRQHLQILQNVISSSLGMAAGYL